MFEKRELGLGKLNVEKFLERARKSNFLVDTLIRMMIDLEDVVFEIDTIENTYSSIYEQRIYNFNGWCVLESEIDFIEE